MKNIHVLPTDKPSRLRYFNGTLQLMYLVPKKSDITFQHIYITNSEEIKEGDWVFNFEYIYIVQYDSKKHDSKFWYKKIILTTDQDLIKDGVQPIDDEFLEWFVKNPSCEEVNVKESLIVNVTDFGYKIIIPHEEPKQETLEEAAEKYINDDLDLYESLVDGHISYNIGIDLLNKLFTAGAKWQKERMYSEEDMREVYFSAIKSTGEGRNGECASGNSPVDIKKEFTEEFEEWFEQFKKK